jgi:hypothetical protein
MNDDERAPVVQGIITVTDLLGLGKAAEKLTPAVAEIIKAIGAGAGRVYEPASIYLNERAQRAAERHNAVADAKAYLELTTRSPDVLEAMRERILGTEYRRQENIDAAETEALQIAQSAPSEPVREVHPDFMTEWVEGVKDVSDEMVRRYWAHLLAAAPATENGRVPKPVVDLLKLLDQDLCRDLEYYYMASFCTNGIVFGGLTLQNSMAQEVGLGLYTQRSAIETNDRTLRMVAQAGYFQVFQMGERATRLCELAFPEIDEGESLEEFYRTLPDSFRWLALSQSASRVTLELTDSRQRRHYFDIDLVGSQMIKAKRPNTALLEKLDLSTKVASETLRASLLRIADSLHYRGAESVAFIAL